MFESESNSSFFHPRTKWYGQLITASYTPIRLFLSLSIHLCSGIWLLQAPFNLERKRHLRLHLLLLLLLLVPSGSAIAKKEESIYILSEAVLRFHSALLHSSNRVLDLLRPLPAHSQLSLSFYAGCPPRGPLPPPDSPPSPPKKKKKKKEEREKRGVAVVLTAVANFVVVAELYLP